ncbi:hypothetical protein BaRGS_00019987 [Batillaria attramentaria]|uniref:Uncharacterized protein n=1 Tax=Batillaria attramentaria TaxID=370345 RepID=A0ABD0KNS3_9CAEN
MRRGGTSSLPVINYASVAELGHLCANRRNSVESCENKSLPYVARHPHNLIAHDSADWKRRGTTTPANSKPLPVSQKQTTLRTAGRVNVISRAASPVTRRN